MEIGRECQAEIDAATETVEGGRDVRVIRVIQRNASDSYSGYPDDASSSLNFMMEGTAVPAIMNSPQFMNIISTDLIGTCQSVSLVKFTESQFDQSRIYGLVDGSVSPLRCTLMPVETQSSEGAD